ncbi:unnamed protein product [Rotaria sp. Silwood2]|nr:unnamed protein product [Rotaria sp. Silwood2]
MNILTLIKKELPNEKFYLFINRLIFSFLFLFVGLPLWYSTTSTYRAPLPYSRISTLASKPSDLTEPNLTSFQTASSYEILFYLINNNDENYSLNKTIYEEIISSTIVPYLINTYSNYINIDISTEIIFNTRGILPSIETFEKWINLRTIENYNNGRQTLLTLSQLLLSIPNIVIDDSMAKKIHNSLDLLEKCQDNNQHNDCQQGRLLADQVFFDPSLLKLLYFPDDQKFAIYVPLFLPMGAPLAWTLFNDIKFLINIVKKNR